MFPLANGSTAVDGANKPGRVAVYIGDPAALDASAEWPGEGPIAAHADRYVREQGVRVTPNSESG